MVWKPHVTVAAVIEDQNRFLFVEETINGEIVINQPAGHLDENESLINAVIRETREETAYEFVPEFISGIYQWQHPANGETFLRIAFTGQTLQHHINEQLDEGIIRAIWLTPKELDNKNCRSPMVKLCIEDYIAGKRYPLDILHDLD